MLDLGAPLPESLLAAELLEGDGSPVTVRDLVAPGPTLLVFLRHFGCVGCSLQVSHLAPRAHELAELGVRSVYVGSGNPAQRDGFVERLGLGDKPVTLVCDPALGAYGAADMHRSLWSAIEPRAVGHQLRAYGQGFQGGWGIQGDNNQQGGALLLDAELRVAYARYARFTADLVDGSDVVAAATKLRLKTHTDEGGYLL